MNLFFKKKVSRSVFGLLLAITFVLLKGCASYKAKPLEDFTEKETSHLNKQNSNLVSHAENN